MAAKKETPVQTTPNYESYVKYEEQMSTIKTPGEPRYRALQKIPYLEFGEHKVYLSKLEYDAIMNGTLDPQKLLDEIPVQTQYKGEF